MNVDRLQAANPLRSAVRRPAARTESPTHGERILTGLVLIGALFAALLITPITVAADTFSLTLRSRQESSPASGRFHLQWKPAKWQAKQTAVIVCDMWDLHHCLNATLRGGEMAPRMNRFLITARNAGATIIHAPSSCMATYKNHPARRRAEQAPKSAKLPAEIGKWCYKIPAEEKGTYPIDQTDGGEDDDPDEHRRWAEELKGKGRNPRSPWKSQVATLTIDPKRDLISDRGDEIWSAMESRGIKNVILVGVHTNMCVLGRPFGLRNMARYGKNVVLVRDLTDTMYNPARKPFVSHFTGTDLIVEHIEKWVCPTITSDQLLGDKPFRFAKDTRPHVVIVTAEREYKTNETLPPFALAHLGKSYRVSYVFADDKDRNSLPGLDRLLNDADLALISVRRRVLPKAQMEALRRFVEQGKPVVGIRTANHAFSLNGKAPPADRSAWESFDADVIGGHYTGHHGAGPKVAVTAAKQADKHPILNGVDANQLRGVGSLYKVSPLDSDAQPLLVGSIPNQPAEPIAWTHKTAAGGRVFYTSLGHVGDFQQEAFTRLLANAIAWALNGK